MSQQLPLLDPAPHAVGIFPEHYNHGHTVSFKMQQKALSFSGGDFTVTGVMDQNVYFRVKGKYWSIHGRKMFMDGSGHELFELGSELMHLHTTYVAKHAKTGREIFRVKAKIMTLHNDMTVTLWNESTSRNEELIIRGDWLDRSAEIRLGRNGPLLAVTTRNLWTAKEFFAGASTYAIHVAPGVDCALMCALCICLDEIHDENSGTVIVAV